MSARPKPRPELTAEQRSIVASSAPVVFALGGPGTGKTVTLVESVVAAVTAGSKLEDLLVIAPSRSEAQEMRRAIARRLEHPQIAARVTTVHGAALGLLRSDPDREFRLLRAPEQELKIRELLDGVSGDFWPERYRHAAQTAGFVRQLREFLNRARQLALDPEDIQQRSNGDQLYQAVARFAALYQDVADMEQTVDYAELLHRARIELADDEVARSLVASTRRVFIDDLQDFDPSQAQLIADLGRIGIPLSVFCDPQQRIGAFRGATSEALTPVRQLDGIEQHHLTQSFRGRPPVVAALASVKQRIGGLDAPREVAPTPGEGAVASLICDDASAEIAHVAARIHDAHQQGVPYSAMAVITREGRSQLAQIGRRLTDLEVPVSLVGADAPLIAQATVQALFAAVRYLISPSAEAGKTVLASPLADLDKVDQRQVASLVDAVDGDVLARCLDLPEALEASDLPAAQRARGLVRLLNRVGTLMDQEASVAAILWAAWDNTEWPLMLQNQALDGNAGANAALDAVVDLFDLAARREELRGKAGVWSFIQEVSGEDFVADTGRETQILPEAVQLLTAHRARTGEWSHVWVVGVQEGQWPRGRPAVPLLDPERLESSTVPPDVMTHLADERRLFYVACATAKSHLTVSAVHDEEHRPSRFVAELGLNPIRVHGRPRKRLTLVDLVSELRRAVLDPQAPESLRRGAALRLSDLAQNLGIRSAAPTQWWGMATPNDQDPDNAPIVLSGSSLHKLLTCPRRWFLDQRARAGTPASVRATLGTIIHELVSRADVDDLDAEALKARLAEVWERIEFPTQWESPARHQQMNQAIDRFHAWRENNHNTWLGSEVPFTADLQVAGHDVRLVGAVDRLELCDSRLRIVDYKSGKYHASSLADYQDQLGVYQLAASLGAFEEQAPGVTAVAPAALVFIVEDHKGLPRVVETPSIDDQPYREHDERADGPTWIHDRIAQAVAIISSGEFPAQPCEACRYCPFADSCPAKRKVDL